MGGRRVDRVGLGSAVIDQVGDRAWVIDASYDREGHLQYEDVPCWAIALYVFKF